MAGRRPNGSGSIRKIKDGLYEGRYTLGKKPDGKQDRPSIFGKTKKEVSDKLQEIETKVRKGTYVETSKETLEQWLEEWLDNTIRITNKKTTYENYSMLMYKHVIPRIGHIRLDKLKPSHIQNMMAELIDNGRIQVHSDSEKGLSNTTVRTIRKVLRYALQKAIEESELTVNPVDATKAPPLKKPEINVLEPKELVCFLENIKGNRYELIYVLALKSGLRRGELLGLRWKDIDFTKDYINVRQQLVKTSDGVMISAPKSNRSFRRVIIDQDMVERLRKHKAYQNTQKLKACEAWQDNDLVFCSGTGQPIPPNTISQAFRRLIKQMGLRKIRFHDLRHTFATNWLDANANIKTLQYTLGHAKVSFTLDTYTHVTEEMLLNDAHKMESYFESLQNNNPETSHIPVPF